MRACDIGSEDDPADDRNPQDHREKVAHAKFHEAPYHLRSEKKARPTQLQ